MATAKTVLVAVLKKDLVVDRDAVIQGAIAVEIVEPIDGAGIALDAELASIDANLSGRIATRHIPADERSIFS